MTPELRALADRFIFEQATVKHIASLAPPDAFERTVHGGGWTVRQLFAHLAACLGDYQALIERLLRDEPPLGGWDRDASNRQTSKRFASASLDELLALFGSGLNGLIAAMAAIPDERLTEPLGPGDVLSCLQALGEHYLSHAIVLVDALPEVRFDPLVLNWLLSANFEEDDNDEPTAWQQRLLADAEEYIASQLDEESDEGDE